MSAGPRTLHQAVGEIDLPGRLAELTVRDAHRLGRRLQGARAKRDPQHALAEVAAEIEAAEQRVARRRAAVPRLRYPEELPVSLRRDDIAAAIRDHQVVVVAGETGSGKTTQLPKICLGLGRGVRGAIGHTQPRRIAARTVAERIAAELDTEIGGAVGWKVRFTDHAGADTLVKLMTDGILLAEIQRDRLLRQYDTLIIDEAHERSLNVDFLLGYLRQLLPRRPDLKVVITSATIDPQRFARHFDDAPVIEVSGRTYPVEVRYRPIVDPDDPAADPDRDQTQAICDAVREVVAEGPGDILVFLSGEREIRDTRDALGALAVADTEIVPLYARLSAAEQHRVFAPHRGRRIVLATNVAETSLTVPGIRYVIDPGTARISRYSQRLKVQRLPIEAVSRASAAQRAGRCGRTSDGICVRLYSEEDFLGRPEFTDPEILRTHLASVILQMAALDLGDIAAFPFVDPPDRRNIADGVQLLEELGAFDPSERDVHKRLTSRGRRLVELPIDPRLGRMVLAAMENGCLHEVLVIAAALSIQDPRERPVDAHQAADALHARFVEPASDFLGYLNLWRYLADRQEELSSTRFRKLCKAEFLHYLRVREWQDLYAQLRQVARTLGATVDDEPADPALVHRSLLAGLLSHVGLFDRDKRDYTGARGARFAVFPGSALFRTPPTWVMAAELVETSRLWGRDCARIEPEWAERLGAHLVKRSYSEPHWERRRAGVVATEKVTLYGVPLVAARTVDYGAIDPELSRELFIRHALVAGDWETRHEFFHHNRALLEDVEELEHRARRRDILVDDETLFAFYDQRIGPGVVSGRHFDRWWRTARRGEPDLLTFPASMLVNDAAREVGEADYPDCWTQDGSCLPLSYQFEPGTAADGVTVHIPLPVLNQVRPEAFEWQIPGLRAELVTALLRSLPKPVRRGVVPVPDTARAVLARVRPADGPLLDVLERELHELRGLDVPREAWRPDAVPDHLRVTFRVTGEDGATLAEGKDLDALQRRMAPRLATELSRTAQGVERSGLRDWDLGALPRTHRRERSGYLVTGYPALVDEGDTVAVRVFATEAEQRRAMWQGTRRLLLRNTPSPVKQAVRSLSVPAKLVLSAGPHASVADLLADCVDCAADAVIAGAGGPAWDRAGFDRLLAALRTGLAPTVLDVLDQVRDVLAAWQDVQARLAETSATPGVAAALADIRTQLAGLVHPGFVTAAGAPRLPDLVRYLRAVDRRLDTLPRNPQRDREWMAQLEAVQSEYHALLDALPPGEPPGEAVTDIRWMIEELRVSYFAQSLPTRHKVSDKRIFQAIDQLA